MLTVCSPDPLSSFLRLPTLLPTLPLLLTHVHHFHTSLNRYACSVPGEPCFECLKQGAGEVGDAIPAVGAAEGGEAPTTCPFCLNLIADINSTEHPCDVSVVVHTPPRAFSRLLRIIL